MWTQWHSLVFDVSVWEIWGALLHGGRLVVVSESVASSPDDLHDLLVTEKVTVLCQTPSAAGMLSRLAPGAQAQEEGRVIGYCIVGLGRISMQHFMPAVKTSRQARVTALVSGHRDKAEKMAAEYGVRAIPTLLIFQKGQVAEQIVGLKSKRDFKTSFDKVAA